MRQLPRLIQRKLCAASLLGSLFILGLSPSRAEAQPAAQPAVQPAPQPATATAQPAVPAAPAAPPNAVTPPTSDKDPLAEALLAQPGGLTPEEVAATSARLRPSLRAKQAEMQAAAAKVDQALVNYFPRVTLTATYTRLSPVDTSLGGGAFVGVSTPGLITVGPCPPGVPAGTNCVVDSAGNPAGASAIEFPALNNSYSFTANILVPISDYVLRISQGYAAASHAEKAKKLEAEAEALKIGSDGKIAYFNWVRAKGQVVVAHLAVEQAKAHVADAKRTLEVGFASRADVLRLEAQVASAEQVEAEATAFLVVADEQLRILMGAKADKEFAIGVDVMSPLSGMGDSPITLEALQREALSKRLEIRALDETEFSLKEAESATKAGYLPRVDAFADFIYANPNQRIFPQRNEFNFTWDVGVRLTWVVNDTFTTIGAAAEAKARTQTVAEQKAVLREGLRLEVASAYAELKRAMSSIESATRQLAAAEESMRVRVELFRAGRATSTDIVDAEAEVTRARLRIIDARVGLLVAKVRLDHAVGRDVK